MNGLCDTSMFNLLRNFQTFPKWLHHFHSCANQDSLLSVFLIAAFLVDVICISVMTNDVGVSVQMLFWPFVYSLIRFPLCG
jgi:hypothetical protein